MPLVTSSLKDHARAVIPRTETHLVPALGLDVLAHVKVLLGFYYKDSSVSAAEIAAYAEKWVECLSEFPEWSINAAIKEWLKNDTKGRRPVPGQIVELCRKEVSKYRLLLWRAKEIIDAPLPEPPRQPPTPEERQRVSEIVADCLKNIAAAPGPISRREARQREERDRANAEGNPAE